MLFSDIPIVNKVYQPYPTSKMNASCTDCPICMDVLDMTKNCVTTECGHSFHASCLMTNVAHNGFDCPYCRTAMAEEPQNDEEDSEGEEEWSDVADEDDNEAYDDYALRGLRFMTDNLEGVAHDIIDVYDENEEEREQAEREQAEREREQSGHVKPSAAYIAEKLIEQGITVEQLVKSLLLNHEEYEDDDDLDRAENDIFGKTRIIISNYRPEDDQPAAPVPRPAEPISSPLPPPTAEPKTPITTNAMMARQSIPVV